MDVGVNVINMSNQRLREVSQYILDAMNQAQADGYPTDEVILATGFCTGVAIARIGGILSLDKPLRDAFPPLIDGYQVTLDSISPGGE